MDSSAPAEAAAAAAAVPAATDAAPLSPAAGPVAAASAPDAGSKGIVVVTGANGFVGSWVAHLLAQDGFTVRGTVRSPAKHPNLIKALGGDNAANVTLHEGDVLVDGSLDSVLAGADFLVHTAAVVALEGSKAQLMYDTARKGTLNVLESARKSKSVRKVVLTSSVAAVHHSPANNHTPPNSWSEADWNETSSLTKMPYAYAKTTGERTAWKFVEECPAGEHNFKLVCINPSLILGPSIPGTEGGIRSSYLTLQKMLDGSFPAAPNLGFGVVSVVDVARAHVNALKTDKADGKRVIISNRDPIWMIDMAKIILKHFPNAPAPTRTLPNFLMYLSPLFEPQLSFGFLWDNLSVAPIYDNTRSRELLGLEYASSEDCVVSAVKSMLESGAVKLKEAKK